MTPQIIISKVDYYNNQKKLVGAKFKLTEMVPEGEELKETTTNYEGTTDDNGSLTFGTDQILHSNTVYQILETKAPEGYVRDNAPHYVLIAQMVGDKYPDYSDLVKQGVKIHYATPQYTYTASNHKGEIVVHKAFQNADGTPLEKPRNGTYHFGLFTDEAGTNRVKETQAVFAYGNQTVEAKFTDVTLDTHYYVYELNDRGQPILGNGTKATVSGIPFVVSYTENSVMVTAKNPSGAVTVTNRINYAELPQTGGGGISAFRTLGTALVLCAAGAMMVRWCRMAQYMTNGKKSQTRGRRRGRYEK